MTALNPSQIQYKEYRTLGNMNCPNCNATLSDRGYFCQSCELQARCRSCREPLEPGAMECVECGTKLGASNGDGKAAVKLFPPTELPAQRNILSYSEDRSTRRFEASLTDTAIQGLGEVLGDFFVQ